MKSKKIVIIVFLILIMPISYCQVNADSLTNTINGADEFLKTNTKGTINPISQGDIKELSNTAYGTLALIGMAVAVVVAVIMGIKFVTGSVEEQAKIKEMMIPFIVGCVVVFGAYTIWTIVVNVVQNV